MIIRNSKNNSIVNLGRVTAIYPSINEGNKIFNLYFVFDSMNDEQMNEVKWEFRSKDEIDIILEQLSVVEV